MIPSFNSSGPCVPGEHYMLPPERRLTQIMRLIEEKKYFTLTGGWQIGKTTCARWLVNHYNRGERYACVWIDLQTAREKPDPAVAFRTILNEMHDSVVRDLPSIEPPERESLLADPSTAVLRYLRELCRRCPRPLVALVDEADCLIGETMVSFLTQFRRGYLDRSATPFPHSVALIGRRQVRDYTLSQKERQAVSWLGTASPFNVSAEAATLSLFSRDDVVELLGQHTTQTGQGFTGEAVERIFYLSQGHPWLVNAIADQIVNRDVEDRTVEITTEHVEAAKETIILSRRTHIDSLIARLHEERVIRILQPMLVGEWIDPSATLDDDFAYVLGLGLIARRGNIYEIANPIYREVIPRVLSYSQQMQMGLRVEKYPRPDGGLDMGKIMKAWQAFWREHGHVVAAAFSYREAGPHLMLMAFLQSLMNGRGRIEREYGLGRQAMDLLMEWKGERYAIEVKLRRDRGTEKKGLAQLGEYLDLLGLQQGWLVLFDQRKGASWKEKLWVKSRKAGARRIWVVGC